MGEEGIVVLVAVAAAGAGVEGVAVSIAAGGHHSFFVARHQTHIRPQLHTVVFPLVPGKIAGVGDPVVAAQDLTGFRGAVRPAIRVAFEEGDLAGNGVAYQIALVIVADGAAHIHAGDAAVMHIAEFGAVAVDGNVAAGYIHKARGEDAAHELLVLGVGVGVGADQGHIHIAVFYSAVAVADETCHAEHPVKSPQLQSAGDGAARDAAVHAVGSQAAQEAGGVDLNQRSHIQQLQIFYFRSLQAAEEAHKIGVILFLVAVDGGGGGSAGLRQFQIQQGVTVAVKGAGKIRTGPFHPGQVQIVHENVAARRIFPDGQKLLHGVNFRGGFRGKGHRESQQPQQRQNCCHWFHRCRLVS